MIAQHARWPLFILILSVFIAGLIWFSAAPLRAQTPAQESGTPESTAPAEAEPAAAKLPDEELDALVTRIALYPDPLLAVVLQAATLPLQIVEADRFLEKRAKDPKAEPRKDWDSSVTALLNYASVVKMMSDDLNWTQSLGDAVIDQLGEVQDSIQQFRAEVQAAGLLKTDDKQTVTVEGDTIKIEPAQAQVIYVPMYDGPALAAALAAPPPASAPQPATSSAPAGSVAPAQAPASSVEQAAPAAVSSGEPAQVAAAPAVTTAAGGNTVVYPPAYPPAYPPPAYSQPYPSFWTPGASFAGGAVVGGLLGYAIGEDNDDFEDYHHGDGYGGGRNVSDNKVVSGNTVNVSPDVNRRDTNTQTQAALRQRSGGQTCASSARAQQARAQVGRGGVAPAAGARTASANRAAPERTGTAAPRRDQASAATADRSREARRPGNEQPGARTNAGALSDQKSGRESQRESARGAESRGTQARTASAAPHRQSATPQRQGAAPQAAQQRPQSGSAGSAQSQRPQQASGGALASQGGDRNAAASANRGANSRGGAGSGGGGGGRRR